MELKKDMKLKKDFNIEMAKVKITQEILVYFRNAYVRSAVSCASAKSIAYLDGYVDMLSNANLDPDDVADLYRAMKTFIYCEATKRVFSE